MRSWLEPHRPRERLLRAAGFLVLGVALADAAIVGPAWSCSRAPLSSGGDMVPGFCADYGRAWFGWPALVVGLAAIAAGLITLWRAAEGAAFEATLRHALVLASLAGAVAFCGWSLGAESSCLVVSDAGPGGLGPFCETHALAWQPWALVASGALAGAALTLVAGAAALTRSRAAASPSSVRRE